MKGRLLNLKIRQVDYNRHDSFHKNNNFLLFNQILDVSFKRQEILNNLIRN